MKRFLSIALSLAIAFSLSATSFATSLIPETLNAENIARFDGHLINADGTISSTTIDDIDQIIYERNRAILAGNTTRANLYQQQLRNSGAKPSTSAEIMTFAENLDMATSSLLLANSNVSYDTYTYYAYANGTRYQIKRITANPTTESNLFHSATINNKTISSSVDAGHYELFKVTGSFVAGLAHPIADACITAYDALKSVITGFTPSTTVYGITASYACAALEQVSFYQVYLNGYWTPFAASSYVQTAFSSTIFGTDYSGGSKTGLQMSVSAVEDAVYSPASLNASGTGYDTGDILERYFTTYLFDKNSQVTHVSFYHDADGTSKYIETFGMVCPTTTYDVF